MDQQAHDALTEEWIERGRSIAAFVTANVPATTVPVAVFDHVPLESDLVGRAE